ncbi:MAG: DNA-processing protein DprA [Candidatus Eremiobacteraeota bacterium]|nr:DNA-processing protein DprA [Candidatus Eremiobacteraeota bacterium]
MLAPRFLPWTAFGALRGERPTPTVVPGLWICGELAALARPTVAIVLTRAATDYGRRLAQRFALDLAQAGCCILSGSRWESMWRHIAARSMPARRPSACWAAGTIAFSPNATSRWRNECSHRAAPCSRRSHPGHEARPFQFLARNGVVAALSDAVVVVEAPQRSGALNTAAWAAGRIPVFAVPGDVDRAHVRGCHALIRDGATLARDAADVLLDLGLTAPEVSRVQPPLLRSDPVQRALLDALGNGECALDALVAHAAQPVHAVLSALAMLELEGAVEWRDGNMYALAR